MQGYKKSFLTAAAFIFLFTFFSPTKAQDNPGNNEILYFQKKEQNVGIHFFYSPAREELQSENTYNYEELNSGSAQFQFNSLYWNFLDYKQEQFNFNVEIGPFLGTGNWIDSTATQNIKADQSLFGLKTNVNIDYTSRYYWDRKNYTIVDLSAWGKYDVYKQVTNGNLIDSNQVLALYDNSENKEKFRYGFQAKAGWGFGRLNPMNHFMLADYFLNKYYQGRNFSRAEIVQFADEIGKIKQERNLKTGHNIAQESEQLAAFIKEKLLLSSPGKLDDEFQYGEFLPRFNGQRFELGPFFNYFNREPDFIYGIYIQYENLKYKSVKWNRNFGAKLNYNRYKKQDWILAELDFGWSYYPDLQCQWDFGLKYAPGAVVNEFQDIQAINHILIPYFAYYRQVNSKVRIKANAALRIADDEQFMMAGPEFSLAVYWSKY